MNDSQDGAGRAGRPAQGAPAKKRSRADLVIFAALAALGAGWCLALLGPAETWYVLGDQLWLMLLLLPMLAGGLLVAGLIDVLVPKEFVERWLGAQSGLRGILIASAAGSLTPGGPFASFPVVLALYKAGADIGTTVAYVTGWATVALHRAIVWEVPLVGVEFALVRVIVSVPLPIIAGLLARHLVQRLIAPRPREVI